ncbi:MAG: HPr family phosphocarrier protein [Oscillospiraceae bacterium]
MVSKMVTVINDEGLHMRPAGVLAKAVKAHPECEVTLCGNGKTVKAKSPMQVMSACFKKGSVIELKCSGADEQAVLDELSAMFESGFEG